MKVRDPVCGMAIDGREARATREFREHTLHFCSETCASRFDLAPKKYWKPTGREGRAAHEHRSAEVAQHDHRGHISHHATMVADFRRRFWVSLLLTVPILLLSHPIQKLLGLEEFLYFPEAGYLQFLLATLIYVYGGVAVLQRLWEGDERTSAGDDDADHDGHHHGLRLFGRGDVGRLR